MAHCAGDVTLSHARRLYTATGIATPCVTSTSSRAGIDENRPLNWTEFLEAKRSSFLGVHKFRLQDPSYCFSRFQPAIYFEERRGERGTKWENKRSHRPLSEKRHVTAFKLFGTR